MAIIGFSFPSSSRMYLASVSFVHRSLSAISRRSCPILDLKSAFFSTISRCNFSTLDFKAITVSDSFFDAMSAAFCFSNLCLTEQDHFDFAPKEETENWEVKARPHYVLQLLSLPTLIGGGVTAFSFLPFTIPPNLPYIRPDSPRFCFFYWPSFLFVH